MSQLMPPGNLNSQILHVLGLPLLDKLYQLEILFERCTVRQIQEIYPLIVHSIFGINGHALGWGLRTTTFDNAPHYFERLHQFFGVNGVWMQICHRLLNETIKFDIDVNMLPRKFMSMLQAVPMFYADLINIDPLKHQVSTLSLNTFDFYIFHFVLYALQPLHTVNPIALQIHTECLHTVYQLLTAEYLDNFLPQYPDARIQPVNFCSTVKASQQLPPQALQPMRQLRYLKLPSSYRSGSTEAGTGGNSGSGGPQSTDGSGVAGRGFTWRSESVLYFFVDIWLRYDIESEYHMPSSDFVRGVRTLIKQIHFFGNGMLVDRTPLCTLRKVSQPMLKASIYAFLCGLIERWPLDSSLRVVLELWLSYIQPWRYTFAATNARKREKDDPPITKEWEDFIMDNLTVYTHIFMQLLPRFERLDYSVYHNVHILHRLSKTFAHPDLIGYLARCEKQHSGNIYGYDSPQRQVNMLNKSHNTQWNSMANMNLPPLFSKQAQSRIQSFLYVISTSRNAVMRDNSVLRKEILERERSEGILKYLYKKLVDESSTDAAILREAEPIPELLRQSIYAFCNAFAVNPDSLSIQEKVPEEPSPPASPTAQNFSFFDENDCLDTSKLTPLQMSLNASNLQITVDPTLLPIKSHEITPLVRLMHFLSEFINEKFGSRLEAWYARDDFFGKLSRQLLFAPMTEQWFEKHQGHKDILENQLPPRISLRTFGSIKTLGVIVFALIVGHTYFGVASIGLFILCAVLLVYILLKAMLSS